MIRRLLGTIGELTSRVTGTDLVVARQKRLFEERKRTKMCESSVHQQPLGPTAFVDCGRGIRFNADFIVGWTLRELIVFLQENFDFVPKYFWFDDSLLPRELRISVNDLGVEFDYVVQVGDVIILDPTKKLEGVPDRSALPPATYELPE